MKFEPDLETRLPLFSFQLIHSNAALNEVPTPRAGQGELAHPGLEPAGVGSNCV